jgi:hypothetical protein
MQKTRVCNSQRRKTRAFLDVTIGLIGNLHGTSVIAAMDDSVTYISNLRPINGRFLIQTVEKVLKGRGVVMDGVKGLVPDGVRKGKLCRGGRDGRDGGSEDEFDRVVLAVDDGVERNLEGG